MFDKKATQHDKGLIFSAKFIKKIKNFAMFIFTCKLKIFIVPTQFEILHNVSNLKKKTSSDFIFDFD